MKITIYPTQLSYPALKLFLSIKNAKVTTNQSSHINLLSSGWFIHDEPPFFDQTFRLEMIKISLNSRRTAKRTKAAVALFLTSLTALGGCSANYGKLKRSYDVTQIFEAHQVLPDHRYYFSGPEGRPDAIMGVHSNYTLQTTQWTEVDLTPEKLKKWVDGINFHHPNNVRNYPYGFFILDPDGKRIGFWYSVWDWTTVIADKDNRVVIYPPFERGFFDNGDDADRMKKH